MAYGNKQNRRNNKNNKNERNMENKSLGNNNAIKNKKVGKTRVRGRKKIGAKTPTVTIGNKIVKANEVDNTNPNYREFWKDENVNVYMEAVFERIADLLLEHISQLQPYLTDGFNSIQKTYRDGIIVSGRNSNEPPIIHESNIDASFITKDYKRMILDHLDFTHPDYITMRIEGGMSDDSDGVKSLPNIYIVAPSRGPLNIDKLIGSNISERTRTLEGLNASQFINVDNNKININRFSLTEHVNTTFSEIIPNTIGTMLDDFTQKKEGIPFYSYRTEDFFKEYSINTSPDIPMEYRVQKFFEQYEEIKDEIPAGTIPPNEKEKASSTYLIQETAKNLTEDIPAYTATQLEEFINEIERLKEKVEELHIATGSAQTEIEEMTDKMYDFDEDDD